MLGASLALLTKLHLFGRQGLRVLAGDDRLHFLFERAVERFGRRVECQVRLALVEQRHQDALTLFVECIEQTDCPLPLRFRLDTRLLIAQCQNVLQVEALPRLLLPTESAGERFDELPPVGVHGQPRIVSRQVDPQHTHVIRPEAARLERWHVGFENLRIAEYVQP